MQCPARQALTLARSHAIETRDRGKAGSPIWLLDADVASSAPQKRVPVDEQNVAVPGALILEEVFVAVKPPVQRARKQILHVLVSLR